MQNIYDKKWFWGLFENIVDIWLLKYFMKLWKWTMYFKYINLWAFDVVLPLCQDFDDYPVRVATCLCNNHDCVTTLSVLVYVTTLSYGLGWGFWFWNSIGYFYGSQWIICSFIVILGSLVLHYFYYSCNIVNEIDFA